MRDRTVTERPVMRWVPVTDERGRTHMEMRWSLEPQASTARKPYAA